jgi:hypothetical protein
MYITHRVERAGVVTIPHGGVAGVLMVVVAGVPGAVNGGVGGEPMA